MTEMKINVVKYFPSEAEIAAGSKSLHPIQFAKLGSFPPSFLICDLAKLRKAGR